MIFKKSREYLSIILGWIDLYVTDEQICDIGKAIGANV